MPEEKLWIVKETFLSGCSVLMIAHSHALAGNLLSAWRRSMAQGALTAASAGEEVVSASRYLVLESEVLELKRLLGKKTMGE
jgi:transposase